MHLLLVDDHPIFSLGLRQVIQQEWPDAKVTEARDLTSSLPILKGTALDGVLLDVTLPDAQGVEGLISVRRVVSAVPVLMLGPHVDPLFIRRLFEMG